MARLYVTGWLKRGPTCIIGTNRADSIETVENLLSDVSALDLGSRSGIQALLPILERRGVRTVTFSDWLKIDVAEIERGKKNGKPREKFTRVDEMLSLLAD